MCDDADLVPQDLLLRFQYSNTHTDYRNPVGEKGLRGHSPSQRERPLHPRLDRLYCFSRPPTSKMVLIYYSQVCLGWLSLQTQERKSLSTSKGDICNVKGEMVEKTLSHTWGVCPDSGKIRILSKHLLPQFRVREFFSKSKSHSSLCTMQA